MSDIPVGSPPAPPGRHAAPGGWYADPVDPAQERYWDGWQWSRNTRTRESAPSAAPGRYAPARYAPARPIDGSRPGQQVATADGVRLAGWGWRFLAALLDGLITSVLVTAVTFPIYLATVPKLNDIVQGYLAARQSGSTPPALDLTAIYTVQQRWILMAAMLAIGLTYHMVFLRWKGATVGKMVCGLRVVPLDQGTYEGSLSWNAVAVRAAIWVVPGVFSVFILVSLADVLFPLWQAKRQAIHDVLARTQVTRPVRR